MSSWCDITTSPFIEPRTLSQAPLRSIVGLGKSNVNKKSKQEAITLQYRGYTSRAGYATLTDALLLFGELRNTVAKIQDAVYAPPPLTPSITYSIRNSSQP